MHRAQDDLSLRPQRGQVVTLRKSRSHVLSRALIVALLALPILAPSAAQTSQSNPQPQPNPGSTEPTNHKGGSGSGVGVQVDLGSLFGSGRKDADSNTYVGKPDFVTHNPAHEAGALGAAFAHRSLVVRKDGKLYERSYYYVLTDSGPRWYWYDRRLAADDLALERLQFIPDCSDRSDNCGGMGGRPPLLATVAPTPAPGDPEGGIDLPGYGKAHRGTGTRDNPNDPNDKRASFSLWITKSKDTACKSCAWYQYVNVTVKLDGNDVTGTIAKDGKIKTSIGTDLVLGKWNGDYHKDDEKKQGKKPKHENMPGSDPPVDAGPYASAPIDGTPGAEGLVDAPNWGNTGAWKELVTRLAKRGKIHKSYTGADQPPDSTFTLTITSNFRDYLYCTDPRACLGWSEATYVETLKFKVTWSVSSSMGDNMDLDKAQTVWNSTVSFVSSNSSVTFGKWNACP